MKALPWILALVTALLLSGIAFAGLRQRDAVPVPEVVSVTTSTVTTTTAPTSTRTQERPLHVRDDVWESRIEGTDEVVGAPVSRVTLTTGGTVYDFGTSLGSCTDIASSSWEPLQGEYSGMICYFAGGGDEYGVFMEGGKAVVKKGYVEEGSADAEGGRGGFETIAVIE